jgi:mediator of RNA polymerase II transcription subunit 14
MEKPSVPRNGTNVRNIVDPKITSFIPLPIGTASPDLSYAFMSALNIFAAGVISHHANLQALHVRRCAYMLRQGNPARAITLPSIYVRVEDILPSKNKPKRTGRGWVRNVMRLNFQGIETIMQSPSALAQGSNGDLTQSSQSQPSQTMVSGSQQLGSQNLTTTPRRNENSFVVIEARMVLPAAKSIESINERVDRDIAFNSRTGSFAFRLRCKVGEAVIDKLVEVAVRVERLVEFSKVLQKHAESKSLTIDMVSLGRITFTYGHVPVPTNEHSMNVDHQTRTYKATIDFGAVENTMALILEKGNPHIRIIDHLTKVLNSTEGLNGVATLLTQTLPVNRGLDSIERNWPLSVQPESNEMFVNVRAADWYIIRYGIRQLSLQGSKNQPTLRNFVFAVRLRQRRGKPWWFVQRTDNLINGRAKEADALDGALKPLWNSSGTGWQGKSTSGVAEASGIYELLERLNEVMQNFATANGTDNGSGAAQVPVISQPSVLAPVQALPQKQNPTSFQRQQHQQHQQRQQLHTPNQSQNHGQGRNHPVKQEVVEID